MKHKLTAMLCALVLGGALQVGAANLTYEGEISNPNQVSLEATSQLQEVAKGKSVADLNVKAKMKQHLTRAEKAKLVIENGEYIDPKDSVFQLARPEIDEYRLAKYDKINIQVIGYSRGDLGFSGTAGDANSNSGVTLIVGPDGRISTPYTGVVKLAGLTLDEASNTLSQKFKKYIKNPNTTVSVSEYGGRQVYVMGEVSKPGIYRLGADYMNVFAAISSSNGLLRKARPKHIQVVRVRDNTVYVREVNLDDFIKKQDIKQNIALEDGDMIYIPRSGKILLSDIMPFVTAAYAVRNF